jgi:hypothetical protein
MLISFTRKTNNHIHANAGMGITSLIYLLFQYIFHVGNDALFLNLVTSRLEDMKMRYKVLLFETNSIVSFFSKLGSMDEIHNALSLLLYLVLELTLKSMFVFCLNSPYNLNITR